MSKRASDRIVSAAKALADPNRVEIMRLLNGQDGALCACDIVEYLDLSQPTVSHHLKVLRDAGLLESARKGLWVFYEANPAGVALLECLHGLPGGPEPG